MVRALVAVFLVAHGAVHAIMFGLSYSDDAVEDMGFDPGHSWLLGDAKAIGLTVAAAVTLGYLVAGAGHLLRAEWWQEAAIGASVLSLLLMGLFHSRYWFLGYPLSAAVIALAWWSRSASV